MSSTTSTLGPHAKVVALTEGMINRGLRDLHQTYLPFLNKLKYFDVVLGDIDLDLKAPELLIKDENNLYFKFNIVYGSLRTTYPTRNISLEGWTITHPLEKETLLAFAGSLNDGSAPNPSIERIFQVLIRSADGGFRPDPELSVRSSAQDVKDGKTLKWREWSQQCPEDYAWAKTILGELPKIYKSAGYTAIGYAINLPTSRELRPQYLQIGTDKQRISILDYVRANNSPPENRQAPQFNSILLSGEKPGGTSESTFSSRLYTTNFVAQSMGQVVTDVQSGFYTINCRDILEDLVLPQFRLMNEASVLRTGPAIWTKRDSGIKQYKPMIELARNFAGSGEEFQPKEGFNFTKSNNVNGSTGFEWGCSTSLPEVQTDDALPTTGKSHKYQTSSSSKAIVYWEKTGITNSIKFEYTVKYTVISTWAASSAWEKPISKSQYTYRIQYFFAVEFDIDDNGILKISLTGMPHKTTDIKEGAFNLEPIDEISFGKVEMYELGFYLSVADYIKKNLFESTKAASGFLQARFDKEMKFPLDAEASYLTFKPKPLFNVHGDLVVGIQYKTPIPFFSGFLKQYIARPKTPEKPKPKPPRVLPKPTTRLSWTYSFTQDPDDEESAILDLSAKNTSAQLAVSIGYFAVTIKSDNASTSLVSGPDGEAETIPPLFTAPTIKKSAIEFINPPCEWDIEVSLNKEDKKCWDIKVLPLPGEDEEAELTAFKVESGDTVNIKVQARCDPEKWTQAKEGSLLGEVFIKEHWKDEENPRLYKGQGSMIIQVISNVQGS